MAHNERYADPYAQASYENSYGAPYAGAQNNADLYNPPSHDASAAYQANASTEKMVDDYPQNTERAQPGRSGLRNQTKSWADVGPPPRSTGILRMWRKDERGHQWTRGGGFRSSLRMCCCCVTITLIIFISVVLAIALFVRPPSVLLNDVELGSSPVSLTTSGLTVSFSVKISVSNPNWFNVDFKQIKATAKYPGSSAASLGGGTLNNVNFKGHTQSTFDFPFTLNYTLADDPNRVIINDFVKKCGVSGGTKQDIKINYDLALKLKVLGVTVSPTISNSASFECPISASDIESILGSSGL